MGQIRRETSLLSLLWLRSRWWRMDFDAGLSASSRQNVKPQRHNSSSWPLRRCPPLIPKTNGICLIRLPWSKILLLQQLNPWCTFYAFFNHKSGCGKTSFYRSTRRFSRRLDPGLPWPRFPNRWSSERPFFRLNLKKKHKSIPIFFFLTLRYKHTKRRHNQPLPKAGRNFWAGSLKPHSPLPMVAGTSVGKQILTSAVKKSAVQISWALCIKSGSEDRHPERTSF